jgi:hypothetical protein
VELDLFKIRKEAVYLLAGGTQSESQEGRVVTLLSSARGPEKGPFDWKVNLELIDYVTLHFLILCFRASQYKSNETPT